MQLQDYINDVQELVHDVSQSIWPQARVISRINQARLYTSLDMKCVRQLVTGVQLMPSQELYDIGIPQNPANPGTPGTYPFTSTINNTGAVVGANVTAGGSGYGSGSSVPVTFAAAPAGGVTAQGVGVLTNGALTSITMTTWGQGYPSAPAITVGGIGTLAAATAITMIGVLYPLSITYIFNGIRTTLRYIPFGLFQAYARILGVQFLSTPGVWTYVPEANLIYVQPMPNMTYLSEWDCVFMAQPLVNTTDYDSQVVEPYDRAAQYMAASQLLLKTRSFGESQEFWGLYERMIPKIVAGMGDVRIPNIYNRNFQRLVAR